MRRVLEAVVIGWTIQQPINKPPIPNDKMEGEGRI